MHFQSSDSSNQHHHIRPEIRITTLNVEEFLHAYVCTKSCFCNWSRKKKTTQKFVRGCWAEKSVLWLQKSEASSGTEKKPKNSKGSHDKKKEICPWKTNKHHTLTNKTLFTHKLQRYFVCQHWGIPMCNIGKRSRMNKHRGSLGNGGGWRRQREIKKIRG